MKKNVVFGLMAVVLFAVSGCLKLENQSKKDDGLILDYINKNGLTMEKHSSGLYYRIDEEGSGISPTIYNAVTVNYKGYLLNGSVFDQTDGNAVTFQLLGLIKGWQIGIPLIKKGGKILLILPSELGYGSRETANIPSNSVLVFEIELVNVK